MSTWQGVFSLLDEECLIPKGTDDGYVTKMNAAFNSHKLYSEPTLKRGEMIQASHTLHTLHTLHTFLLRAEPSSAAR